MAVKDEENLKSLVSELETELETKGEEFIVFPFGTFSNLRKKEKTLN